MYLITQSFLKILEDYTSINNGFSSLNQPIGASLGFPSEKANKKTVLPAT